MGRGPAARSPRACSAGARPSRTDARHSAHPEPWGERCRTRERGAWRPLPGRKTLRRLTVAPIFQTVLRAVSRPVLSVPAGTRRAAKTPKMAAVKNMTVP